MPLLERITSTVAPMARPLTELVFPNACIGCDRTLLADEGDWCSSCAQELAACVGVAYCCRCGAAVGEYVSNDEGCADCRGMRHRPDGLVRIGTYHDLVGQALRRFKFDRQHRYDRCLGGLLADAIEGQDWCDEIEALIPVPTTWRGRFRYRCWPTSLLAHQVARRFSLPVLPCLRVKGKKIRQVGLPQSQRAANVRGKFHVHRTAQLADARVCIIDDVSTTGATLREITRVLHEAGAAQVFAAVLAKTDPHRSDVDPLG